jgi:simple sugar transport system permease protein
LLGGSVRVHGGLILAVLAAVLIGWLIDKSTLGFRLRAVGANQFAARTAGMSVENSYITVMLIAGALCGLAGVSQILGTNTQLTGDIDAGIGFDAITVALLGRANPKGIVAAGLLFGALHAGGTQMQSATGTPIDLVQVIQSLIVLFIAAPMLVRVMFRLKGPSSVVGGQLAKGWNG